MINRMKTKDRFKLGTFSSNCSSGMTVTKSSHRWNNSWENNLKLAKMLDAADIDFMLPIARWVGYGGETDFHGSVLEAVTWATGLLAQTERLTVFATVHTAANNPVVVAKQISTMDHIGQGRGGRNLVAGWNKPEYKALGLTLPDDHETRYAYAQEWFDIIEKLWTSDDYFDWKGDHFDLEHVIGKPKPTGGRPPILNAAGSGIGRAFATKNADYLFTPAPDLERSRKEIIELREMAQGQGRDVGVLTIGQVICRETEAEAVELRDRLMRDLADWDAVDNLINMQLAHAQSFPHDLMLQMKNLFALGHGGVPLVGTPQQVADGIIKLHEAGFNGSTIAFLDYNAEFPYFRDNVLPLLKEAGLR